MERGLNSEERAYAIVTGKRLSAPTMRVKMKLASMGTRDRNDVTHPTRLARPTSDTHIQSGLDPHYPHSACCALFFLLQSEPEHRGIWHV